MTESARDIAPEPPRAVSSRKVAGPPGWLFALVTLVAILVAVEANTRESLGLLLLTVLTWLILAGV